MITPAGLPALIALYRDTPYRVWRCHDGTQYQSWIAIRTAEEAERMRENDPNLIMVEIK